ncbi:MAG: phytoene desaturase family protein [Smithellaceae bacterium]
MQKITNRNKELKMKSNEYDVVIIGAGMGGLITGAVLAKQEGMKVLVLEKESEIGGRCMSFGGHYGDYTEEEYRRLLGGCVGAWVIDSYPALGEIIENGLFRDHIIEGGWHGMSAGDRNRFSTIAKGLGKRLPVDNPLGFLYWRESGWVEIADLCNDWPKESFKERNRVAAARQLLSREEAYEYFHISLREYLETITDDQRVIEYYTTMARWQMCINDESLISAGDWILCNNMTSATGRTLSGGGGMGDVKGGIKNVPLLFASIITENGGEIVKNARVKEVVIKDHKATGVVADIDGQEKKIYAKNVISNLQMNQVFSIIPKETFPRELRTRIESYEPVPGVLLQLKTTEPLEKKWNKGIFVLDRLPGIELKGGQPNWGFEQTSEVDPSRILNGKGGCLTQGWMPVSGKNPDEIHNKELMLQAAKAQIAFLRKQYPKFDEILEWYIIIGAQVEYGVSSIPGQVGDRRPGVKHPNVRNMFFTGDTVSQWDVGTSGVAHGALICASAVTGKNCLQLLPEYMR